MNKETEQAVKALMGNGNALADAGGEKDWKTLYEESQRQLQSARVDQGRVAKLDAEKKELEKQLHDLQSRRNEEEIIRGVPEGELEGVPNDIVSASAKLAAAAVEKERAATEERLARIEQERAAEREAIARQAQDAFVERINDAHPGFIQSAMLEGGDKHEAWNAYLRHNKASVREAFARCDYDSLEYHINAFYEKVLHVPVPSAGGAQSTASDPSASSGGSGNPVGGGKKLYTQAEYDALEKSYEEARANRDYTKANEISRELDSILSEGRIKG